MTNATKTKVKDKSAIVGRCSNDFKSIFLMPNTVLGMNETKKHCNKSGVPRMTQIKTFVKKLIGLNFTIDRNANINPKGIANTKVSAKSFSVTLKPMQRS